MYVQIIFSVQKTIEHPTPHPDISASAEPQEIIHPPARLDVVSPQEFYRCDGPLFVLDWK
jgi:hypothetical protein